MHDVHVRVCAFWCLCGCLRCMFYVICKCVSMYNMGVGEQACLCVCVSECAHLSVCASLSQSVFKCVFLCASVGTCVAAVFAFVAFDEAAPLFLYSCDSFSLSRTHARTYTRTNAHTHSATSWCDAQI